MGGSRSEGPRPGRFDDLYGILPSEPSTDELIDEQRGPAELP